MKRVLCIASLAAAVMARPAQACEEVSSVVGYRRCGSFGDGWDLSYSAQGPSVFVSLRNPFARRSYRPGTLTEAGDDASGGGRRLGCIDLRAKRVLDAYVAPGSVVVAFHFGNGCDRSVRLDLGSVRVTAHFADGSQEQLALYDPASEVQVGTLDARDQGRETLQFNPRSRRQGAPTLVFLDVSAVAADGPRAEVRPIFMREAREPIDEHEVIGHNGSVPYAFRWDWPNVYFFAEMGAFAGTTDLRQGTYSGVAANQQKYSFSGASLDRAATYGVDMRGSFRVVGPLYAGFLIRSGGGHLAPRNPIHVSSLVVHTGDFEDTSAGGLVGAMIPGFAGVRVRGEVAAGVRIFDVNVDHLSCRAGYDCTAFLDRPVVEPRVLLDAWLSPWCSTSAWVALDAIHPDGAVGLSFAFHLRSFDGAP
jgi:hypothetical protein